LQTTPIDVSHNERVGNHRQTGVKYKTCHSLATDWVAICQGWRTSMRPAKHSGETSSYYFRLLFVSVEEQLFSFLTGFVVW